MWRLFAQIAFCNKIAAHFGTNWVLLWSLTLSETTASVSLALICWQREYYLDLIKLSNWPHLIWSQILFSPKIWINFSPSEIPVNRKDIQPRYQWCQCQKQELKKLSFSKFQVRFCSMWALFKIRLTLLIFLPGLDKNCLSGFLLNQTSISIHKKLTNFT